MHLFRIAAIAHIEPLEHVQHMWHGSDMSKMIQVRNVPDKLHRELVRRAEQRDQTLTDYIQGILEREVARPSAGEVFERIASRAPVRLGAGAANLIRKERASRETP
jgi:plasmid stability protein